MNTPVAFSVIIPTQGSRQSLRAAVESVLQQSYPHFELVVVSDGDVRRTREMLAEVADPRVWIVNQEPKGVSSARNLGISKARHPWVTFLDDDDLARPHWLESWASAISDDSLAVTAAISYRREGDETGSLRECHLSTTDPTMGASTILAGGFAVRRDLLLAVGGYDARLRVSENQDLGLRLCEYISATGLEGAIPRVEHAVVDVFVENHSQRDHRYGSSHKEAAKLLQDRYRHRLTADPSTKASLLRIIARHERLEHRYRAACLAALGALRVQPMHFGNVKSLLLALFPTLHRPAMWLRERQWRSR
ncbi:glycosyltransferase family A protein [Intrasporangium sp. DVR]|uniref:glycosyltransferase family 2 protein n=1 Tax=Intrasporangium sp. DVR TaxID=3127867 RepID=UPI00313A5583